MNFRNVKLALTVNLLNDQGTSNLLSTIRDLMNSFKEEAGKFLELALVNKGADNNRLIKHTYALKYENCTLNVDLIRNTTTSQDVLYRFDLN